MCIYIYALAPQTSWLGILQTAILSSLLKLRYQQHFYSIKFPLLPQMCRHKIEVCNVCGAYWVSGLRPCRAASIHAAESRTHSFGIIVMKCSSEKCSECLEPSQSQSSSGECDTAEKIGNKLARSSPRRVATATKQHIPNVESPVLLYTRTDTRAGSIASLPVEYSGRTVEEITKQWLIWLRKFHRASVQEPSDLETCSHTWIHDGPGGSSACVQKAVHLKIIGGPCRIELA